MDNLTHSLVGATLAELALPASAPPAARRVFFAAGVIAANLPDADLLYTRITPPPLGYLLHHRGHTHTLAGIAVLGLATALVCALPRIRAAVGPLRARVWMLLAVALLSHLVLDAWNSYGVHPFWPVDSRWYYGDAVFIAEPWLWTLLGVPAVLDARRRAWRVLLGVLLVIVPVGATMTHALPLPALLALAVAAAIMALVFGGATPHRRALAGLVASAAFVLTSFILRDLALSRVRSAAVPRSGRIVDVVQSPAGGNPLCWRVLVVTRDDAAGEYAIARGSATVGTRAACGTPRTTDVVWDARDVVPLARLRAADATDCWVRAWLQFARAPVIRGDTVLDLRFGAVPRANFTAMPMHGAGAACPARLTDWRPPRADLLDRPAG